MQKYKRGNLVKFTGPYKTGDSAIVLGSYTDLYGNQSEDHDTQYSLIYPDTGNETAWTPQDHLEFVEEGGDHLILAAKDIWIAQQKMDRSLKWIVNNFNDGNLGSESILYLFERINYVPYAFLNEGSYIHLVSDWRRLGFIFVNCINLKTATEMISLLESNGILSREIMDLFLDIKDIQNNTNQGETDERSVATTA